MAGKLPAGVRESDLVPDPAGRAGVWIDKRTDTPYALGLDFRNDEMEISGAAAGEGDEEGDGQPSAYDVRKAELIKMTQAQMFPLAESLVITGFKKMPKKDLLPAVLFAEGFRTEETMRGKRVALTFGRFEGQHATITSVVDGDETDTDGYVEVLTDSNDTLKLDDFEAQARFLTAEEIAADEAALKESKGAAGS